MSKLNSNEILFIKELLDRILELEKEVERLKKETGK